jgi:hypothetical protein
VKHIRVDMGHSLLFWEGDFHKIKGREILSRSHKGLNTTDDHSRLNESFSTSAELCDAWQKLKVFGFEIFQFFLTALDQNRM